MSARIIPYMRRDSVSEFKRRRQAVLEAAWFWLLMPLVLIADLYLHDEAGE